MNATLKVSRPRKSINAPTATQAPAAPINKVEHAAAVWAAVNYLAAKEIETSRDELTAGKSYGVNLYIAGQIDDGPVFRQSLSGKLDVGHSSEVAASHTPGGDKRLIAIIMGKLNQATREALLRELPTDYAGDEPPTANAAIEAEVDAMLKALRAGKKSPRRGIVKFDGKPSQPSLSLIG